MGILRRFFKAGLTRGPRIIYSYFAWMRKFAKNASKYPHMYRQTRLTGLGYSVTKQLNFEYFIEGEKNLPNEASGLFANHLSEADPLALISIFKNPVSFISKEENRNVAFVGKCVLGLEGKFIKRDDLKQTLKVMMEVEADLKNKNKSWIIFPDGTRQKDCMQNIPEFHHGSFRPAFKAKVPIVPVAIYGTQSAMTGRHYYKKNPIYISYLKPIMPEEYESMTTNDIAKLVHDQIQQKITFDLRPKYNAFMSKQKDYSFNQIK